MNTHTTQIPKSSRIGVVGAGPAGVSFAYFLHKQGFNNITLLESAPHISGKSSSFEVGGRGFDVGALMVGTNYHNIHSLASELSLPLETFKGRALDIDKGSLVHEDTHMICVYDKLLPHINHYLAERSHTREVSNPGHGTLSEEQLFAPIGQYLKGKQMEYMRDAWALAFTSAGYGYFEADIPAAYFLKFVENSENKISYFPDGFCKLWEKMAEGINVITNAHVTRVDRSLARAGIGPVLVTYESKHQQTLAFDYIVIAANPRQAEPFLDITSTETALFKQLNYFDYYTIIATVDGLSTRQGLTTIPKYCQDKGYVGHITAFYCAYDGVPTYSFYAYGSTEITQEKMIEYFHSDIEKMGGSIREIHYSKHWDFFPHVNSLSMARGFYSKAEGLQGQHNTFYTGGWLDLELTENCVSYSKDLVTRFFSGTPNESQHLPISIPVEVRPPPSTMNLGLALKAAAEKYPEKAAFTWVDANLREEMQFTFARLYRQARSVAQFLVTKGHKKGDRVLLCYAPGLKFLPILFGCFMCGVIAVPVAPPNLSTAQKDIARFTYLTHTTGARICFSDKDYLQYTRFYASKALVGFVDKIKWPEGLTWIEGETISPKTLYEERLIAEIDPNDVAVLQFSSGSTGDPKGVMLTHKNLLHNVDLMQAETGIHADSIFAFWVPQFHDLGLIGGFLNTIRAASRSVVMSPLTFLQRPEAWLQMISKYRANFTAAPNFAYELAARKCSDKTLASLDLSCLIGAFNGAEPVRWSTLHAFSKKFESAGFNLAAFKCLYGLAEHCAYTVGFRNTHGVPTVIDVDPQDLLSGRVTIRSNPSMPNRIVATGVPNTMMQVEVRIVDPDTRLLCPPNVVGEVWLSSPSVGEGYYGKEELSEEVFRAKLNHDDDQDRGCFLRTGDLGFMHKGQLFITGRLKDVIIINGKNHYPHDIELTVQQCHLRIRPGCVAALHHHDAARGTDALIILAEIKDDKKAELGAIVDEISRMVPANHGLPAERVALLKPHSIPKTTSGKLQRGRAKAMLMAGELDKKILLSDGDLKEKTKPDAFVPDTVIFTLEEITSTIAQRAQKISKLVPRQTSDINANANLIGEYGFDSLAAVQLTSSLKNDFKVDIPPSLLYDIPTISGLAKHVAKLLPPPSESIATSPPSPTFAPQPSASLAEIEATLSSHVHRISRVASKTPLEKLDRKANMITDYGFDSLLAVQLTALIRESFHVEVAPAILYDIYTIGGLAEHVYKLIMASQSPTLGLERRRREIIQDREVLTPETTPILVPLAPRNVSNRNNPALFCIHPLLGNVAAYVHISRVVGITRPVYGIQSPTAFPASVTTLAKRYADLIQREQPSGPYYLCGYSYGGLIAWEIAKQLAAFGEKVGGLFLVDAPSPLAQTVKEPIGDDKEAHIVWEEEIEQLLSDVDSQWMMRKRASDPSQIDDLKRLIGKHIKAMYAHTENITTLSAVQPFPIHYWRAKDYLSKTSRLLLDHPFFHDPHWGWRQYKGSITFYNAVPGHHYSVLTEDNCGRLGRELDRALPKYNRRTSAELRPLMLEKIANKDRPLSYSPCKKSASKVDQFLNVFNAQVPLYYVIAIVIAISYTMQRITTIII